MFHLLVVLLLLVGKRGIKALLIFSSFGMCRVSWCLLSFSFSGGANSVSGGDGGCGGFVPNRG